MVDKGTIIIINVKSGGQRHHNVMTGGQRHHNEMNGGQRHRIVKLKSRIKYARNLKSENMFHNYNHVMNTLIQYALMF